MPIKLATDVADAVGKLMACGNVDGRNAMHCPAAENIGNMLSLGANAVDGKRDAKFIWI